MGYTKLPANLFFFWRETLIFEPFLKHKKMDRRATKEETIFDNPHQLSTTFGTNWYCSTCRLGNTFCTQSWKILLSITAILFAFSRAKIFF
jgi:hypothetical protein